VDKLIERSGAESELGLRRSLIQLITQMRYNTDSDPFDLTILKNIQQSFQASNALSPNQHLDTIRQTYRGVLSRHRDAAYVTQTTPHSKGQVYTQEISMTQARLYEFVEHAKGTLRWDLLPTHPVADRRLTQGALTVNLARVETPWALLIERRCSGGLR
jgi:hypothetical protein